MRSEGPSRLVGRPFRFLAGILLLGGSSLLSPVERRLLVASRRPFFGDGFLLGLLAVFDLLLGHVWNPAVAHLFGVLDRLVAAGAKRRQQQAEKQGSRTLRWEQIHQGAS